MTNKYDEVVEPSNAVIGSPLNNARVSLAATPVSGTTSLGGSMPILVSLYRGTTFVGGTTAAINGDTWSATLNGPYPPGAYRLEVFQAAATSITVNLEVPAPFIEKPQSGDTVGTPFSVEGRGGVFGHGTIDLYTHPGSLLIKNGIAVRSGGDWVTSITLPSGASSFIATQNISIYNSNSSAPVTVARLLAPDINVPASGGFAYKRPVISGRGQSGATVNVWQVSPLTLILSGAAVGQSGNWSGESTKELAAGQQAIKAQQTFNGTESPETGNRSFVVLSTPVIREPDPSIPQDVPFKITGNKGDYGTQIHILEDFESGKPPFGTGSVKADGSWEATVTLPPGPISLVAEQVIGSVRSGNSAAHSFKIKPPAVGELKAVSANGNVEFSGTGYDGVGYRVDVHLTNVSSILFSTDVLNGRWSQRQENWAPGRYSIRARQRVSDGVGGWIYSSWSQSIEFNVIVPAPTLNPPTNLPSQKPRFSGTGDTWEGEPATQVQIQLNEVAHPFVPDATVAGNQWEVTATQAIAPGTYFVRARQVIGSQTSDWFDLPGSMIIPAPLPTIETIIENGLSPDITGTCWAGAQVRLWYDDAAGDVHAPTVTGTTWRFRRPESFSPGAHEVTVTQTFGGQTSSEVSGTFTVAVPRPVITRPIDEPVGHETSVAGRGGIAGSVMKIFNYVTDLPLGEAPVTGTDWSVALKALEYGPYTVYAQQFFEGFPSEKSERVTFEVVLLAPDIDVPQSGDDVARTFRIEGRARVAAEVELWLDGVMLDRVRANVRGEWWYRATLPLGAGVLQARQFLDDRESELSLARNVRVVPDKPVMETPAAGQAVERRVAISGFGYPGDTVTVARVGPPDIPLGSAVVQENTTWSFWADLDVATGRYAFVAQQSCEGYDSGWSGERAIVLHTDPPQFVEPLPGRWGSARPLFKGTAKPGTPLELTAWYNRDVKLAEDVPITGGAHWQAEPRQNMPQGAAWASARQVDSQGAPVSASGESDRFDVLPPEGTSRR